MGKNISKLEIIVQGAICRYASCYQIYPNLYKTVDCYGNGCSQISVDVIVKESDESYIAITSPLSRTRLIISSLSKGMREEEGSKKIGMCYEE